MRKKSSGTIILTKAALSFPEGIQAYTRLKEEVTQAGILQRDYWYYLRLSFFAVGGFLISLYVFAWMQTPVVIFLWSFVVAFFTVQVAGLMHDAGHRAIFWSPKLNDILGYIFGALTVVSYAQWRLIHNLHHAHTNEQGVDPDLDLVFHTFTMDQLSRIKGLQRHLTKYQAFIFYPMRSLLFIPTRLDSFFSFKRNLSFQTLPIFAIFLIGVAVWFVVPFGIFPLWKALMFFFVVNIVIGFYASNVFASNHKAMPQIPKGTKLSFFEQQVVTARNVDPSPMLDFFFMGLNYQIEHHLFPGCPRNKLKLIRPYIQKYCKLYGIEYTSEGLIETNRTILSQLSTVAHAV